MKCFILIFTLLLSANAYSHDDHGHHHPADPMGAPITEKRVEKVARVYLVNYVNKGALEKTWNDAKFMKKQKKKFRTSEEWVVTFKNKKVKDKKKQVLYVFMRIDGKLVGANFTGQ